MKTKPDIVSEYQNKILAIESFGKNNKIYYDKFIHEDDLLYHLYELNCHEISLTDDGLNFIREYYGLEEVVLMILNSIKSGVDYKYKTKDEIIKWLELKGGIKAESVIVN